MYITSYIKKRNGEKSRVKYDTQNTKYCQEEMPTCSSHRTSRQCGKDYFASTEICLKNFELSFMILKDKIKIKKQISAANFHIHYTIC
jgi:hypothetical protein